MKKYFVVVLVGVMAIALPAVSSATELKSGEEYSLSAGQIVEGDMYAGAGTVSISGDVHGDAVIGAGTVNLAGNITGDLIIGAGTINLNGTVGDDVRVVGGNVTIGGSIKGDLVVAGGQVEILPSAKIGGDIISAAGTMNMEGEVAGKIMQAGGQIRINGRVAGPVNLRADKISLGDAAVLSAGLIYKSPMEATIGQGAKISGETKFTQVEGKNKGNRAAFTAIFSVAAFIKFLMLLTATLVLGLAVKRFPREVVRNASENFWKNVLKGFVMLVVIPAAVLVLMITLIGFWLGLMLLVAYVMLLMLACVYSTIVLGSMFYRVFRKGSELRVTWRTILLGAVSSVILALIPFLGWIVQAGFFLVALGTLGSLWMVRMKEEEAV